MTAVNEINRTEKLGNATKTPTLRTVETGVTTSFSVATHRRWRAGEDLREATDYLDVVAWGAVAEYACNAISQGDRVYVQGELRSRRVAIGDNEYTKVELHARQIILVSRARDQAEPERVREQEDEVFAE